MLGGNNKAGEKTDEKLQGRLRQSGQGAPLEGHRRAELTEGCHQPVCRKNVLDRVDGKDPEAGRVVACSRNSQKARVASVE